MLVQRLARHGCFVVRNPISGRSANGHLPTLSWFHPARPLLVARGWLLRGGGGKKPTLVHAELTSAWRPRWSYRATLCGGRKRTCVQRWGNSWHLIGMDIEFAEPSGEKVLSFAAHLRLRAAQQFSCEGLR